MAVIYNYLYNLVSDGSAISFLQDGFSNLSLPVGTQINVPATVSYTYGGQNYGLDGYYQGQDANGNVYFSSEPNGQDQLYYLTTAPVSGPLPDYADRDTGPYAACFLAGVMIATPDGERAVETLAIGDLVLTADGRAVPVKWMGRQSVAVIFDRIEERAPIRIAAGALGADLPTRDLKLTADHALMIDGVLVQAGALVNGGSIRRMTAAETGARYAVWHVETEGHEMILAEGCAAETFVDNVSRRRFDNHADYTALYGEEREIAERDEPRVKSARQLPAALRARLRPAKAA